MTTPVNSSAQPMNILVLYDSLTGNVEDRAAMSKQWRSVQNFPTQAHGAEMLRLACIYAADEGLPIIAPVHDAIMIAAPTDEMPEVSARMEFLMRKASRDVLRGFEVDVEHSLTGDGERYVDKDGREFFKRIMKIIWEPPAGTGAMDTQPSPLTASPLESNMQ